MNLKELLELLDVKAGEHELSRDVEITGDYAAFIYKGLVDLRIGLKRLLSNVSVDVPDIESDVERIGSLLSYYRETQNFSSRGASYNSLSFIKSGTTVYLFSLITERNKTTASRIREAFDDKISSIASIAITHPFDDIGIAECAQEYLRHLEEESGLESSISDGDKLAPFTTGNVGTLLKKLGPEYENRRIGAWRTLESDNPDKLSQAANSIVELLDRVIANFCDGNELSDVLKEKFGNEEEEKWVTATRGWISQTKSKLHRIKHHSDYQSENMTRTLMQSAESIIQLLLK